ncbi:MAG TPA: tandem-95 repeat protein, partial [Tahibacter sp.]|nr:tandem-95 repeat protein [Tahibacter sp.]
MKRTVFLVLAALAFATDGANAATIQLVGGAGFSDATIVAPEGGNSGTTLGQQRTNLFQAAANVWGAALSSSQTIKVNATFTSLSCTATAGTLGSAGATSNIVLNVGTKQRYFAVALAEALVDQDINGPGVAEINANFNSRVDQNDTSCLGSTRFYYGLTGPAPAGTIALYPVVLHELGHGLGFAPVLCRTAAGCTSPTTAFGGYFNGIPDIWSEFVRDNNAGGTGANRHWVDMTTAERAASFTNDPNLVWNGMSVTTNLGSQAAVARNEGRLRTYAPGTYVQGSSVAHFHSDASPNLLMEPSLNSDVFTQTDLTDCLFQDIGWDDSRCALVLNNAPTLNAIADPPAIAEDAGQQTVNLAGIGDGDTLAQIVSITAVSGNPALIPNPAVTYADPATTGTLTYTPVANQSGSAVITVTARDDGDSAYVPNTIERTFTVTVNAVNDAPLATNLSANETYAEDTTLDLTDIVVSDIDSAAVTATLTLSPASAGSLTTGTVGGTTSTYVAGSGAWTASGAIADVNGLLASVAFVPAANSTVAAAIATSVSDGVATAVTGNKLLTATTVNDPPGLTNTSPTDVYVEDTPLDLSDFIVSDPDNATLSVTLQLSPPGLGTLSAGSAGGATSTYDAGTGTWQGSGPIAGLQQLLSGVVFTPAPQGSASGTLGISVSDGIAPAVNGARTLTGTAVNDPPQATNLSASETWTEDTTRNLTDIVASDIDSASLTATLTLSTPAAGQLTTATSGGTTSTYAAATGIWSASGPVADVNALLAGVAFVPATDYNANFSIGVSVGDGLLSVTGTKAMTGVAVNDAPQATNLSANETYTEDTPHNLVDIVVADPDSPTLTVQLTLSPVAAGSLTTATAGSTTSTYTAATGRWVAAGPVGELNTLLANVSFVPAPDSSATATLQVSIDDGVAPAVTGSKTLTGVAVNDAPTAGGATTAQTLEDVPVAFVLTAADIDNATIAVTLSTDRGTLTLPTVVGLGFTSGDGVADTTMTFVGAVSTVGTALDGVTFAPSADDNGAATVTYWLSDGLAPQTRSVAIAVAAVADTVADAIAVGEDGSATFNVLTGDGGASADAFAGPATLTAVSQPAHGSATFAANGSVTYTPAANYAGSDAFTYTVSAGGTTETGQVSIDVGAVNDAPTLNAIADPAPIPPNAITQTVPLSGIGAGPGENQALTVTAVSSQPSVIPH